MNKTIVISGTSKGLGKDICDNLCREIDYNIATISRSEEYQEIDYFIKYQGDISNYQDVCNFTKKIYDKWGKVDILINNAAIIGEWKNIIKYTEAEINALIDVNVKGTFFLTQEILKYMLPGGHIINIGSTRSITGAPNKSLYSMSKFALRALTQTINAELNDDDIFSTIICPGRLDSIQNEVVNIIDYLIKNNIRNIPEIIVGGKL